MSTFPNTPVTIDMVSHVKIGECVKTDPCQHRITITLKDGRSAKTGMYGPEIQLIVLKLSADDITGKWCHYSDKEIREYLGTKYDINSHLTEAFEPINIFNIGQHVTSK